MSRRRHHWESKWLHRGRLRDVVIILCVASAFFFPLNFVALYLAIVLLTVGCLLHVVVKGQLVRNVMLCTEGTYAIVRNPYYLANYLIDISFCLLSGNLFLIVLYPFLFFWAYGPTLREEELRLASLHGDDFDAYQTRVPQVFPDSTMFAGLKTIGKNFSRRRVTRGEIKRLLRFGFIGTLLVLLQRIGLEGMKEMVAGQNPLGTGDVVLLVICAVLLLASVLTPAQDRKVIDNKSDPE